MYKRMLLKDESDFLKRPQQLHVIFAPMSKFRDEIYAATSAEEARLIAEKYSLPYNPRSLRIVKTNWTIIDDTVRKTELSSNTDYNLTIFKDTSVSAKQAKASNLSDEELVMELVKRGYAVSKADK